MKQLSDDHAVTRWYAALNRREDPAAQGATGDGFVCHMAGRDFDAVGMERARSFVRVGFPDLHVTLQVLHELPGFVVVSTATTGTHTHEFMGHPGSGKRFHATGLDAFRLEAGRIVEAWSAFDTEGMLRQLGLRGGGS